MKVILVMVSSVDGKTTKGGDSDVRTWTSKEDQTHFSESISKAKVLIMGRKTYDAAKEKMKLSSGTLRIVMTKNVDKYKNSSVTNQLEFSSERPSEILKRLDNKGYNEIFLLGGANLNSVFLNEALIDELWLTLEPKIFGVGTSLAGSENLDVNLTLIYNQKLNKEGTLLLKYAVNKN